MKKVLGIIFILFFSTNLIFSQTSLETGDIAFVGLNSDGDDEFSFLLLKDISAGTSIRITDKGWNDASGFLTLMGDGIWQWTTSSSLAAGTIIHIKTTNNGTIESGSLAASPGTVSWIEQNSTVISYQGDQVFLYQGTEANPTIITGIHWNVESGSSSGNWDGSATSAMTSALPDQLTNGTNAIWVYAAGPTEKDNFRYKSTATTTGTATVLASAINNISNWDIDATNTTAYTINPFPFGFTVTASAPTTQASDIICSSVQETQMNIAWTNGNGSYRAAFMKEGTGSITNPTDNTTYTASSNWNSQGTQLASSGYYCIYNGTGTNITVTNLTSTTEYTIQVFEFNGSSGSELYNTSTAANNPNSQTSLPVELISFTASVIEEGIKLSWQTATEVNNYGFSIERAIQNAECTIDNWEEIGFVEGHGNSNSPKSYEFIDETAPSGNLEYRLKQIDTDGDFKYYSLTAKVDVQITAVDNNEDIPAEFALEQNYPNPFNPITTIQYSIPDVETGHAPSLQVQLIVYDLLGREVATLVNREQAAGNYSVNFDASKLTSGMYIYRITAGDFVQSRKMLLLR